MRLLAREVGELGGSKRNSRPFSLMSFNCTNTCIKIRFFTALRITNCIHVNIGNRILLLVSSKSYKYSLLLSIVVFVQNLCDTQGPEGSICM